MTLTQEIEQWARGPILAAQLSTADCHAGGTIEPEMLGRPLPWEQARALLDSEELTLGRPAREVTAWSNEQVVLVRQSAADDDVDIFWVNRDVPAV